jgi:N-acetylglucosaminyldiphosphoundecaprenol N-acetyl-beta-D-mannosaminyltransferase
MNSAQHSSVSFSELATQNPVLKSPPPSARPAVLRKPKPETPWVSPPVSEVWGVPFHALTMSGSLDAIERWIERGIPGYAITANLNYAMLCDRDPRLQELTRKAALVLCDGMPIYWRSRWNACPLPERVAGSDLIYQLAERCAEKGLSIYFYGAADGIAKRTAEKLTELYPRLRVAGWQSPPFGATSVEEMQQSLEHIRQAKPDVLLVALGQPKGEYWIQYHYQSLNVPLSIQVGASFDFVAGVWQRAPLFFQRTGLEWLYRACSDPKRLVPRYAKNIAFLLKALRRDGIEMLSDPPTSQVPLNPKQPAGTRIANRK